MFSYNFNLYWIFESSLERCLSQKWTWFLGIKTLQLSPVSWRGEEVQSNIFLFAPSPSAVHTATIPAISRGPWRGITTGSIPMKSMSMQALGSLQLKLLSNKVHLHQIRFVGLFVFFCWSKLGVKLNFCAACVLQFIGYYMINHYSFLVILKWPPFTLHSVSFVLGF